MSAPSEASSLATKSTNKSYIPKENVIEEATEVPAGDWAVTPESNSIEIETVTALQTKISTIAPQEPQYESESTPPDIDKDESPLQEEAPPQTPLESSDVQPETELSAPQKAPLEVPSEWEIQEPAESVDDCIAYGKEYTISIGLALDNTAVEYWDTPITSFDPHYIKRDITSRLNRYKNLEDVTNIWIWKESVGNGQYEIYIGYA